MDCANSAAHPEELGAEPAELAVRAADAVAELEHVVDVVDVGDGVVDDAHDEHAVRLERLVLAQRVVRQRLEILEQLLEVRVGAEQPAVREQRRVKR